MATQLIRGKQPTPDYGILLGVPGVGKSSFLGGWIDLKTGKKYTGAPKPVFIGPERNPELDCLKFPNTNKDGTPFAYQQYLAQLEEIRTGQHDKEKIETLVLDSIDLIEKDIHKMICTSCKTSHIDAFSYGAGRKQAFAELIKLEQILNQIHIQKNINVWIISHCIEMNVNDPITGASYANYEMALHKSASGKMDCSAIFVNKASTILFANQKKLKTDSGNVISTGERVLYTEFRPGHLAKNRYGLPYELPLFYESYKYGKDLFFSGNVSQTNLESAKLAECELVKTEINKLACKIADQDLKNNIFLSVQGAGNNVGELNRILTKLQTMMQ